MHINKRHRTIRFKRNAYGEFFFFSSRRRHTRLQGDWSSDVCSSDLDHPLLDRLIRGRAWIPILGVLLAGIVAMQVEVLKLSVSVGRSVAVASQLQSENQALR